jgi:hypothetical protein
MNSDFGAAFMSDEKPKFTKGTWGDPKPSGDRKRIFIEQDGDGWHSLRVEVDSDDCDYDTAMANANLIVAAPNMYAALKEAEKTLNHVPGDCWSTGPMRGDARDLLCPGCAALRTIRAALAKAQGQRPKAGRCNHDGRTSQKCSTIPLQNRVFRILRLASAREI